ncbi:MAG: hypothetical protein JNK38_28540 [Acidobacteria bacterium]|nr:hypothetical protein [Acidobacteriota bacterium]
MLRDVEDLRDEFNDDKEIQDFKFKRTLDELALKGKLDIVKSLFAKESGESDWLLSRCKKQLEHNQEQRVNYGPDSQRHSPKTEALLGEAMQAFFSLIFL